MSKNHKSSKRKDLAFITFNTVEEAKKVLEHSKDEIQLSPNVSISMAFSQQAMQTKKKIKDNRKHVTNPILPVTTTPMVNNNIQTATMMAMMTLINMNKVKFIF
jgi:hypothetical protein